MRFYLVALALVAAASLCLAGPARAGLSDRERLVKLAMKSAVDSEDLLQPGLKPKVACYCTLSTNRTVGFLVFEVATLTISCAIPGMFSPEGEYEFIGTSCMDFEVLSR